MRRLLIAALLATPLSVLAADPQTVVLDVQNMTCELCPITVKKALSRVPGVTEVSVSNEKKQATVVFDDTQTTVAALTRATTDAGYPSTPVKGTAK